MPLDFPINPTNGQQYTSMGSTWQFNGVTWKAALGATYVPIAGGQMTGPLLLSGNATLPLGAVTLQQLQGAASITASDTAPANPQSGNLWFDSIGMQLYVFYQDPNSSQWVPVNNQALQSYGLLALSGGTMTGPLTVNNALTVTGRQTLTGVADGSNAATGMVGEYLSISTGSTAITPNGAWNNIASLALTAGDWDLWGLGAVTPSGNLGTLYQFALGNAANNGNVSQTMIGGTSLGAVLVPIPAVRINNTSAATYYLNIGIGMSSGTCTVYGNIQARRMR